MSLLTNEQSQTRFLALVLPGLTLCTHTLLALSSIVPGSDPNRAVVSLAYNTVAAGASILGLLGASQLLPRLVSIYTLVHTATLSLATIVLLSAPFDFRFVNPVIPSWHIDDNTICRDIDAGFGWDEEWLVKCSRSFSLVKLCAAGLGLFLMVAQWWALMTVRRWGQELRLPQALDDADVEKAGLSYEEDDLMINEKTA